jgi:hypothetical protein
LEHGIGGIQQALAPRPVLAGSVGQNLLYNAVQNRIHLLTKIRLLLVQYAVRVVDVDGVEEALKPRVNAGVDLLRLRLAYRR